MKRKDVISLQKVLPKGLCELDLSCNDVHFDFFCFLSTGGFNALTTLSFAKCKTFGYDGCLKGRFVALSRLELQGTNFNNEAVEFLASDSALASVEYLNLSKCNITTTSLKTLL